jgi:DNA-binding beta-propeller fold protein YncE
MRAAQRLLLTRPFVQLEIRTSNDVRRAIDGIGRTEDVHFSPSNTKLAVAGFKKNTILVLTVRFTSDGVDIEDALTVECDDFSFPHGVFWLSENRIAVANRGRDLAIVDVPDRQNEDEIKVSAALVLRSDDTDQLNAPGSVSAFAIAPGLTELLVCNNYSDCMTRHLLHEAGETLSIINSEIVSRHGLSIPDGVAYDPARRWAAVSNHNDHSVYVYAISDLGNRDRPAAVLRGMGYPHGVRFSGDGCFLFVADAGAQFIHVFHRPSGEWSGELLPAGAIRAVDDDTFLRGRENEQEGGPKGVDLTKDGAILVASCHQQPLAFFKIDDFMAALSGGTYALSAVPELPEVQALLIERLSASRLESGSLRSELTAIRRSASWKGTAPFRWLRRKLSPR